MHSDNQDRIDAFLRGEMDAAQKAEFEEALKSDNELREHYLMMVDICEAISDRKRKLSFMEQWDRQEEARRDAARRKRIIRVSLWSSGVAACVAAAVVLLHPLYLFYSPDYRNLAMTNLDVESVPTRGAASIESVLMPKIKASDYNGALQSADSLIDIYQSRLGALGRIDTLSEREAYDSLVCGQAIYELQWRRINLLLATEQKKAAVSALKEYALIDGAHKEQAASLLKTIN